MFCVINYLVIPHNYRTPRHTVISARGLPPSCGFRQKLSCGTCGTRPLRDSTESHHARRSRARFGAGRAGFEPLVEEFEQHYDTDDLQAALADAGFDSQDNREFCQERLDSFTQPVIRSKPQRLLHS